MDNQERLISEASIRIMDLYRAAVDTSPRHDDESNPKFAAALEEAQHIFVTEIQPNIAAFKPYVLEKLWYLFSYTRWGGLVHRTVRAELDRRTAEQKTAEQARKDAGIVIPHPMDDVIPVTYRDGIYTIQDFSTQDYGEAIAYLQQLANAYAAKQAHNHLSYWSFHYQEYDYVRFWHVAAYTPPHARLIQMLNVLCHLGNADFDDHAYTRFQHSDYDDLHLVEDDEPGVF